MSGLNVLVSRLIQFPSIHQWLTKTCTERLRPISPKRPVSAPDYAQVQGERIDKMFSATSRIVHPAAEITYMSYSAFKFYVCQQYLTFGRSEPSSHLGPSINDHRLLPLRLTPPAARRSPAFLLSRSVTEAHL